MRVALWLAATAAHFVLMFRVVGRTTGMREAPLDERIFLSLVAAIGSLSCVLHLLSISIGVGVSSAVGALALLHITLAAWTWKRPAPAARPPLAWPELAAIAWTFAILFGWLELSTRSAGIDGTDAAHYHVPNALNIALGASPFDGSATQHMYPMGASVFVAWFIVPFETPFVIDLAMSLPFLLVAASINWMFRLATGLSGLAWASWLTLTLFSMPLVRSSSHVSADLWFTAGVLALMATFVGMWTRRQWRALDLVAAGLALGLVVGTKTTGALAAALVVGVYAAAEAVRWLWKPSQPLSLRAEALTLLVPLFAIAGGGIWLIRNWWAYGSPIAPTSVSLFGVTIFPGDPWQPTEYLSVLGDMRTLPEYDLGARVSRWVRLWLSAWFIRGLVPALTLPIDLAVVAVRHKWDAVASARGLLTALTCVPGAVLVYMLMGAPWTSLEWTRGLALRYVLPVILTAALVSFISLFPRTWRWYENTQLAHVAVGGLIVMSSWWFFRSMNLTGVRAVEVPRTELSWMAAGMATAALVWLLNAATARTRQAATCAVLLATVIAWTPAAFARYETVRAAAVRGDTRDRSQSRDRLEPERVVYVAARQAEEEAGRQCASRRFFALSRFDLPMALEDPDFRTQVFYVGREEKSAMRFAPIVPCDYVIAAGDVLGTDKGQRLLMTLAGAEPLREIETAVRFRLFQR